MKCKQCFQEMEINYQLSNETGYFCRYCGWSCSVRESVSGFRIKGEDKT